MKKEERGSGLKAAISDETLQQMFEHKSKLSKLVDPSRIQAYKRLLFKLREMQARGELPVHPANNYLGNSELATSIYTNKYFLKNLEGAPIEKRPEDVFARLAAYVAAVEETDAKQEQWAVDFYKSLYRGSFLPGGRVIAGAGDLYRLKTLANCFVTLIAEDNIESIYKAAYDCARTYSYGGGIGVDISGLRPRDSVVHNAADKSTGAVSFMEIYSLTTGLIGQSGRRGALMITLDVKHPDAQHFINVKKVPNWVTKQIVEQCKWSNKFDEKQLKEIEQQVRENTQVRFANISLKVSDEFMQAVKEQNDYGTEKILVYKKFNGADALQTEHFSFGIPSKALEHYEFFKAFEDETELAYFLKQKIGAALDSQRFNDALERDAFGDFIVPMPTEEYDFAIHRAGDFMLYYDSAETGEFKRMVKARDIWNLFIDGNYKTAEPGLIFWSTMRKYSPSNYVGKPICSTNPCGEVPLEDGGACNLGSVNLSRFVNNGYSENASIDWDALRETTILLTRFLDNVVIWNESLNPLEKQRKAAKETRRLGLGYMGIADMLNQLGIGYDSEEGIQLMERIGKFIANVTYEASALLAEEKGSSPVFDFEKYSKGAFFREMLEPATQQLVEQKGLRNIALLSIAPTGTISNIVLGYIHEGRHYIGVSGGIEPIFALYYTRRSESFGNQRFKVFHSTVQAYLDQKGLTEKALHASDEELRKLLPVYFFRTSHYVDPKKRVVIQGICQRYIDHSISSTVNLPEDIEPEVISNVYLEAWQHGLKGITIYRDGSRYPILSVEGKETEFQKTKSQRFEVPGNEKELFGDSIITLEDGSLTTVYHALRKNLVPGLKPLKALKAQVHSTLTKDENDEGPKVCINCSE